MDVSRKGDDALSEILAKAREDEDARQRLAKRKKCELKLIRKYDRSKLDRDDCWFMIDANWLNKWSEFVNDPDSEDPPGVLSTKDLLQDAPTKGSAALESTRTSSSSSSSSSNSNNSQQKIPLDGLQARVDYRAVPSLVYFLLIELYGRDSSPDICRYSVDIYKAEVPIDRLVNIKLKSVMEAKIQVNKIRPKWMKWEHKFDDDEEEDSGLCCGLTKEHLESFIYWAIRCWSCCSKKKSGRETIKYSQYKPLTNAEEMDQSVRLQDSSSHSSFFGADSNANDSWWSFLSGHGNSTGAMSNGSTHSVRSSGSSHGGGLQELTTTRNQLHSVKTRGPRKGQPVKPVVEDDEDDDDDVEEGSTSSDDTVELSFGPADKDYERGQWLRTLSGSSHHK